MAQKTVEKQKWEEVVDLFEGQSYVFGKHWSFNYYNDPKRLAFVLSRYKFAAKMSCKGQNVLELGCSDGIGSRVLSEFATGYCGVDLDQLAIEAARINQRAQGMEFVFDDFMGKTYGSFGAVVSLDVVEHIYPEHENLYFQTIYDNLSENGVCVVGTPNITSEAYASLPSRLGHVNLFSQQRLVEMLTRYFHQVLPFGMNDEVVHTGFAPMAHYNIVIACHKKRLYERF